MSFPPRAPPTLGSGVFLKLRLRAYSRRAMHHRTSAMAAGSDHHFRERDDFLAADFLPAVFFLPPFLAAVLRLEDFLTAFFLPPPVSLLTVAHARLAAVLEDSPRFW